MLGKLIGKGRTADVFEYGDDKVIKLFKGDLDSSWIEEEYKINKVANDFNCPAPIVYETATVNGRTGIVFQKLTGLTISELLQKYPFRVKEIAIKAANAHAEIHHATADTLEDQHSFFKRRILATDLISEEMKDKLTDYLKTLPFANYLCHGDLHPENYIVNEHYYIIDWTNAYSGDPASDIARSVLMLNSPSAEENVPIRLRWVASLIRNAYRKAYINQYLSVTNVTLEDIQAWRIIIVAARLCENIESEREWLLNILSTELKYI